MDRLDTLALFVAVAEENGFGAAARRLGRSPAAVTRAVAELEERLGARLFNRTTRAVVLTDSGLRYLDQARRLLADYADFERSAVGELEEPRGRLTLTAPILFGRLHVLPIVQAFADRYPAVEMNILLLDRVVSLIDEGIDLGVRIGHLPDSSLLALRVGSVRRVVCASPAYLAAHGEPESPRDLARHAVITSTGAAPSSEHWRFSDGESGMMVAIRPRMTVNLVQAAVDLAVHGAGITRLLSYQSEPYEKSRALARILKAYEPAPLPIHIVHPAGRHPPAKVRRFVEMAAATLKDRFE